MIPSSIVESDSFRLSAWHPIGIILATSEYRTTIKNVQGLARVREVASVEELSSSTARELYVYWQLVRRDRLMPARADIDPVELKRILPFVMLSKIEQNPWRVRYTLVGTRCVANAGMDFTNRYLDELDFGCDFDTNWPDVYRTICTERRPVMGLVNTSLKDGRVCELVEVLLPLSDDGQIVTHCISIEDAKLGLLDVADLTPARQLYRQSA
jgi:hypothetical protein